jgi:hypothetical protein
VFSNPIDHVHLQRVTTTNLSRYPLPQPHTSSSLHITPHQPFHKIDQTKTKKQTSQAQNIPQTRDAHLRTFHPATDSVTNQRSPPPSLKAPNPSQPHRVLPSILLDRHTPQLMFHARSTSENHALILPGPTVQTNRQPHSANFRIGLTLGHAHHGASSRHREDCGANCNTVLHHVGLYI